MDPEDVYTAEDDRKLSALFEVDPEGVKFSDCVIVDLDIEENQIAAINENTDRFMDIPSPTDKVKRLCARKLIIDHISRYDVTKSSNFKIWNRTGMAVLSSNKGEAQYHDPRDLKFLSSISPSIVLDSLCSILDDLVMPYKIEKLPPNEDQSIRYKMVMAFGINMVRDDSGKRFLIQEGIVENRVPVPSPFLHN